MYKNQVFLCDVYGGPGEFALALVYLGFECLEALLCRVYFELFFLFLLCFRGEGGVECAGFLPDWPELFEGCLVYTSPSPRD